MRALIFLLLSHLSLLAHPSHEDAFRQLEEVLPTPSENRTASGAPGHQYWQQKADHKIKITLNEAKHSIQGKQTITYTNNSPDSLRYLWLQLDRNTFRPKSPKHQTRSSSGLNDMKYKEFHSLLYRNAFDGGYNIHSVTLPNGTALPYTIVETMMRVDLPTPLEPGEQLDFRSSWSFTLNDRLKSWGRSGYEIFPKDGHTLYQVAQFFPRMAAYTDTTGWQHKQFLGRGEFALEFGDYEVEITVPADHIVAATGSLVNAQDVLTDTQQKRLKDAATATEPVFIVTQEEALSTIKEEPLATNADASTTTKTWIFKAENVRDFAFASSRRFIWDAIEHSLPESGKKVWAMSFYPPEAEPLWSQYSTKTIIHTLNVYSRLTFDYPYPTSLSVHGKIWGMEYPMITFNGGRPEEDGTYTERMKKALISVIIHEVGHNWFPMIVNSDERQWSWMDEGLNSFLQSIAEEEWSDKPYNVPSLPEEITHYMKSQNSRPIMTNSESILQFGNNAYAKPAAALTVLRETIMGRTLFDFAFKEYSTRWKFKRPYPADFFRSMEDASGMDLDWFWNGWFYTTKHVDLAIGDITLYELDKGNPQDDAQRKAEKNSEEAKRNLTHAKNKDLPKFTSGKPELKDFYDSYNPFSVEEEDIKSHLDEIDNLITSDRKLLDLKNYFTRVTIKNKGGLVTPIILKVSFDGLEQTKTYRLPAEIWTKSESSVSRLLITKQAITKIEIDPGRETADTDHTNNIWPREPKTERFKLLPDDEDKDKELNPMKKAQEKQKKNAESTTEE